MFSPLSVCLSVCLLTGLLKKTADQFTIQFYGMVGHGAVLLPWLICQLSTELLPRDAMGKCGQCCGSLSVPLSACHVRAFYPHD